MHLAVTVAGLGGFEITVEHETAGGLTTEVESKWPQSLKTEQDKYSPSPSHFVCLGFLLSLSLIKLLCVCVGGGGGGVGGVCMCCGVCM